MGHLQIIDLLGCLRSLIIYLATFLAFVIPSIIIYFIALGIDSMGKNTVKLLGLTGALAYISIIIAGIVSFIIAQTVIYKAQPS